jgi:hypothetical protein
MERCDVRHNLLRIEDKQQTVREFIRTDDHLNAVVQRFGRFRKLHGIDIDNIPDRIDQQTDQSRLCPNDDRQSVLQTSGGISIQARAQIDRRDDLASQIDKSRYGLVSKRDTRQMLRLQNFLDIFYVDAEQQVIEAKRAELSNVWHDLPGEKRIQMSLVIRHGASRR